MKKKKETSTKITVENYIKAVKKADRDICLSAQAGWVATNKVHKSKKIYSRKKKKNYGDEEM
ncbi:MAG: hypothetical protein LBR34_00910 [Prevotella sp.]|jgi:hypothetical protein|nr:hypothetical protein [Prevotella sp.]